MKNHAIVGSIPGLLMLLISSALAQPEPVAYYPFNGNADDESGNGHHGTVDGATLVEDRFGRPDRAYGFDGIDDLITVDDGEHPVQTGLLSVSLWLHASGASPLRYFLEASGFGVFQDGDHVGLAISVPATNNASGQMQTDTWVHFVGTYDGDTITAYIDGAFAESLVWPGPMGGAGCCLTLGGFVGEYWAGTLDDVRIFDVVLSQSEITALYNEQPSPVDPGTWGEIKGLYR
jgi:hypothetical protein